MNELFSTPRLREVLPQLKEFVKNELLPIEPELLAMPGKAAEKRIRALKPKVQSMGLWNLYLDAEHGGPGFSLTEVAQLSEVLGALPFGHLCFNCQAPDAGNIELLLKYADPALKTHFLAPLLAGDIRSCFSMTEPGYAGSNPVNMGTTALQEGNEWVINGHKWFSTAADGAAFAIVMAITHPEAPNPYQRASMIIVPADTPGFNLLRNIPVMGEAGEGHHSHGEIRYENCRVPLENLLGAAGAGFALAQERLGPGRIHHCMRWIGICERAFDMMCRRVAERSLGEGRLLGQQQMVHDWIALSRADIDAARLMVLHCAHTIESRGLRAAAQSISTIKFFVANILQQVLDRAIQAHGALGVTDDTILAWFYRHERGARIYDGPDEVHKSALARKILQGYGMEKHGNR